MGFPLKLPLGLMTPAKNGQVGPQGVMAEVSKSNDKTTSCVGRSNRLVAILAADFLPQTPTIEELRSEASRLDQRLSAQRLHCMIVGQFKRGKSSLLNALLGDAILPTAVVPMTGVSTYVSIGPTYSLTVERADADPETIDCKSGADLRNALTRWVTEEGNPKNWQNLARVSATLPTDVLPPNLVLVDTPGIGSTYTHNTKAAEETLPDCDVAIFVTSVEPPITAEETRYLQSVETHVSHIIAVLNKVDQAEDGDRDRLRRFLADELEQSLRRPVRIVEASARNALSSPVTDDLAIKSLRDILADLAGAKMQGLIATTAGKKTALLAWRAAEFLRQYLASLQKPIESLRDAQRVFQGAADLVAMDGTTLSRMLLAQRDSILETLDAEVADMRKTIFGIYANKIASLDPQAEETAFAESLTAEVPQSFQNAFIEMQSRYQELVRVALARSVGDAERLITRVRVLAQDVLGLNLEGADVDLTIAAWPPPYWIDQPHDRFSLARPDFYDRLLPGTVRLDRVRRRLAATLQELVVRNAEQCRWAIRRAIEEGVRKFDAEWTTEMAKARTSTDDAIAAATARLADMGAEKDEEIAAVESVLRDLKTLTDEANINFGAQDASTPITA